MFEVTAHVSMQFSTPRSADVFHAKLASVLRSVCHDPFNRVDAKSTDWYVSILVSPGFAAYLVCESMTGLEGGIFTSNKDASAFRAWLESGFTLGE